MTTRVVVIEDDALLAEHFARVLKSAQYEVATISHALGAINLIDEYKPSVLIVDMLLVGSTVMPLLHEMASHDDLARLPIVMITSLADDVSLRELQPYGVRLLLDKTTLEPSDLVAAVKKVCA